MKKTARSHLPLLALLLCINTSFKPINDDFKITVRTVGPLHIRYIVSGDTKKININYFRRDSVYRDELIKDPAYPQVMKDFLVKMDAEKIRKMPPSFWATIDSLEDAHCRYTEKNATIILAKEPLYFKQVDSVLHTDASILLNRPGQNPKALRFVLDGITSKFQIEESGQKQEFSVHAPNSTYNSTLYWFLKNTAGFFGQNIYQ